MLPIVNAAAEFSATNVVNQVLTTGTGELDALEVNTGKLLWSAPLPAPDFGGATISGDLVFTSTFPGQVLAFNRSSGQQVWAWQAPTYTNGLLTVVEDTLLVPAGLGKTPTLIALRVGTTSADRTPAASAFVTWQYSAQRARRMAPPSTSRTTHAARFLAVHQCLPT